MSEYIFDMETDGLFTTCTKIHCIVTKEIATGEILEFTSEAGDIEKGVDLLRKSNQMIGHNIIDFDIQVLRKLYNFSSRTKVLDTYKLSQLLQPERYGGHGLAVWGERVGVKKPEHEDWTTFSQAMLHRCREDVEINHKVYDILMHEAWEAVTGVPYDKIFTDSLRE